MGWAYSIFTTSSKCCLPKYLQSANCILVEEQGWAYSIFTTSSKCCLPKYLQSANCILVEEWDGHIQILHHLQNVVSPNIFNPQIVYLLKNGMGIFNFYNIFKMLSPQISSICKLYTC